MQKTKTAFYCFFLAFGLFSFKVNAGASSQEETRENIEESSVRVSGRQLLVDGKAYIMRAVAWNPVRFAQTHPTGLMYHNPSEDDLARIERDFQLIREMGANTLRTYEPVVDRRVLDAAWRHGLRIIVPALNYHAQSMQSVADRVLTLKDHPTTLFWELGNEWNYNGLHGPIGFEGARSMVRQAAAVIRSHDRSHPIASNYGELPPQWLVNEMGDVDLWGINAYDGATLGGRFQAWTQISSKAMYIGEYGADAINRDTLDVNAQAFAVDALTQEILRNLSAFGGAAIGGVVFEWNDEWWKAGTPWVHDIGGIAPGGGPHPDRIFNEEWWGLVDIDRNIRPAYHALQRLWLPYAQAKD